ncbi:hypothetical protein AOC36_04980 [Erysipelothrix larvae]|uniref:Uncharacterized protein n=1 Tax=Erysipelothrix larvae TaxID=1514105 RepID=A0A0X8GZM3_9FIRM|nr:hypothetical protein [Erysipelothrix larvae]AMC93352.1 hypothetical protein AOC36_04980 [Erysipelothrix larvae]
MNFHLRNQKGSILLYTLILMISVCGYLHFELKRYASYIQGQHHKRIVIEHLELEFEIANILNSLDKEFESETFYYQNTTIFIEKTDEIYTVYVSGTSEFSAKYGIISDDSLKWRQIE